MSHSWESLIVRSPAKAIKLFRQQHNLTQYELAQYLGVSTKVRPTKSGGVRKGSPTVSRWERSASFPQYDLLPIYKGLEYKLMRQHSDVFRVWHNRWNNDRRVCVKRFRMSFSPPVSQEYLGSLFGYRQDTVSFWESGRCPIDYAIIYGLVWAEVTVLYAENYRDIPPPITPGIYYRLSLLPDITTTL